MKPFAPLRFGVFALALVLALTGCKKSEEAPGLSAKIQNIVPEAALNDMKAKGLTINEGNTPPNIEGIFETNPYILLAPYGPEDGYVKGRVIPNNRFRFSNQNADEVQLELKQLGSSTNTGSGTASFLAGTGNKFTLFGQIVGNSNNIPTKTLTVISGEITPTGIKDFQYALLLTEKTGDTNNANLIPVNKSRVWIDGDGLASKVGTFRLSAEGMIPADGPRADSARD